MTWIVCKAELADICSLFEEALTSPGRHVRTPLRRGKSAFVGLGPDIRLGSRADVTSGGCWCSLRLMLEYFGQRASSHKRRRGPEEIAVGWYSGSSRREVVTAAAAAAACIRLPRTAGATDDSIRFGLTPVFLNNDLELLDRLRAFLARSTGQSVSLVQRRTYEEITSLLVYGQLTAAWICGYPYIQYRSRLSLLAVPVWRGRPYYQSYLIVGNGKTGPWATGRISSSSS